MGVAAHGFVSAWSTHGKRIATAIEDLDFYRF